MNIMTAISIWSTGMLIVFGIIGVIVATGSLVNRR